MAGSRRELTRTDILKYPLPQSLTMDTARREAVLLKLEAEEWAERHDCDLQKLTRLDRAVIRQVAACQAKDYAIHVRRLAVVLGCSPMGVSKSVRKLERLRIIRGHSHGFRREKYLSLDSQNPAWIRHVLTTVGDGSGT